MKKIAILLCMIIVICTSIQTVFADEAKIDAQYEPDTGTITAKGSAHGITTLMVVPSDEALSGLSESNLPVYYHQITCNGDFSYDFKLSDNVTADKYRLYIADSTGSNWDDFIYFDKSSGDSIVSELSSYIESNDRNNFVKLIRGDADSDGRSVELGIDTDEEDYSDIIIELMFDIRDDAYADSVEFYKDYNFCKAVCSLNGKSQSEIEARISKYEAYLGVDYQADYVKNSILSDNAKSELCDMLSEVDYTLIYKDSETITGMNDFKAVFEALSAISAINNASGTIAIRKLYTEEIEFLNTNVAEKNKDYKNSIATDVFAKLAEMNFESPIDMKSNFDKAVKQAKNEKNDIGSSAKPSSGGGSYSVPSMPVNKNEYETLPDDKNNNESTSSATLAVLGTINASYTDVLENAWYYNAVSSLGGSDIISGYEDGSFRPDSFITRAEFAKLIVSAFSIRADKSGFDDVSDDAWYADYVKIAAGSGIVTGYEGKFNAESNISRQDAAVIIHRAAKLLGIEYIGFEETKDMSEVSVYAYSAVGTLFRNGVINGDDRGNFNPHANISRAEAAQLLYNAIINMTDRI